MATQEQLLQALGEAHAAGNEDAAIEIAAHLSNGEYDPSPVPQVHPQGSGTAPKEGGSGLISAIKGYGSMVAAPLEGAAHVASGMLSGPVAGYAGMGTA